MSASHQQKQRYKRKANADQPGRSLARSRNYQSFLQTEPTDALQAIPYLISGLPKLFHLKAKALDLPLAALIKSVGACPDTGDEQLAIDQDHYLREAVEYLIRSESLSSTALEQAPIEVGATFVLRAEPFHGLSASTRQDGLLFHLVASSWFFARLHSCSVESALRICLTPNPPLLPNMPGDPVMRSLDYVTKEKGLIPKADVIRHQLSTIDSKSLTDLRQQAKSMEAASVREAKKTTKYDRFDRHLQTDQAFLDALTKAAVNSAQLFLAELQQQGPTGGSITLTHQTDPKILLVPLLASPLWHPRA